MKIFENAVYWLQFGPLRRVFRFVARPMLARSSGRVLLGPVGGCRLAEPDLAYRLGIYEIHVQRALVLVISPGGVFYDVGANVGFFSLLGAKLVGDSGDVFAFEPSHESCAALKELCAMNGLRNVTVVAEAVAADNGGACLVKGSSHAQYHLDGDPNSGGDAVPTVTLDSFAATHPVPQVVLMDIEGAEADALSGARELLSQPNPPVWLIEVHDRQNEDRVSRLLIENHYTLEWLIPPVRRPARYPIHLCAISSRLPGRKRADA